MKLTEMIKRRWSKAPDRASVEMPAYFGNSPRLDPVRVIAKACAGAEVKLYSKRDLRENGDSAEAIIDHELYELLDNPCPTFPEIDGWTLRYITFAYIDLVGEIGWLKIRAESSNKIVALLPIPKAWILQRPTINNHYYQLMPYGSVGGVTIVVEDKDLILFKDVDLTDPYGNGRGMSESIADEIETDEYASKYQKNFFFNDATPPYVVTHYNGNEASATLLKKSLMEKLSGFMHTKEPAVLTGDATITPLGVSPRELDMTESRKFLRDECLQHFQIPPEIFGIIENSNRATIDSSFYLMQKNVVIPRLQFFERVITRQLLREYDTDLTLKHDYKVPEDEALQLQIYQFGVQNGCVTREQFCEKFGINPHPAEGTYIMPISVNIVPVGEEINLDEIDTPEEEPQEDDVSPEDNLAERENALSNLSKTSAGYQIVKQIEREQWKEKCWNMFDTKARSKETAFVKAIKKIAKRQSDDLRKLLDTDKPLENVLAEYFTKDVDEAVKRGLASAWLDAMKGGRENALSILGKKDVSQIDTVAVTNDEFNKWVEKYGLSKSKELNQTTKAELLKKLKKVLAESIDAGDGVEVQRKKIQKACADVYEEMSTTRAYLIARTETGGSVNLGQMVTYKANGVEQKEWFSTLDDRTRDSHLMMNNTQVPINEAFEVDRTDGGTDSMQYPLDPNGSAENVCNCRCVVVPVIF